jgi:hypothetical protein
MKEYHKIETIFERDMEGNKKLIEGKFRNPLVEYLKDNEWVFTEKVDGTNVRVYWDGHKVSFNGRTDNAQLHGHLVEKLNELFMGSVNEEIFEQKFGEKEVMFFGEGYGAGIQKGGGDYIDEKDFILFDVMVGNVFLEREDIEEIAKSFNIKCVPIVPIKTIMEAVEYVKSKPISMVGKCVKESEGVVGVPKCRINDFRGNRVVVKIKVEDFN